MFELGKRRKIQFLGLLRVLRGHQIFRQFVHHTPYFDPINSNIVFSDSFLCASCLKVPFSKTIPTQEKVEF